MILAHRPSLYDRRVFACCGLVILFVIAVEIFEGRVLWCRAGDMVPWSWDIWSEHNSQHLVDPYSFTHLLHGIAEYWLLSLLLLRAPVAKRLLLAVFIEGSWEILENSSFVIERYRAETISLNYYGDSILNSISDILCCAAGFGLAHRLRWWASAGLFFLTEIVLTVTIHDSLLINIIMLIHPIDGIKHWQLGG